MDTGTKKDVYDSSVSNAVGETLMSFKPINAIHQHICAFHPYAHDFTRQIEAHHYCTHVSEHLHQCLIYDSDESNAKLIGIEYIVTEDVFKALPQEEKRYWHSHNYEIESGLLQLQMKSMLPAAIMDAAEQPAILQLHQTYGKTIHTWQIDTTPELPLGPPQLMMSFTEPGQVEPEIVMKRDKKFCMSTEDKRQTRAQYLPQYRKHADADTWEKASKAIVFDPVERETKKNFERE